MKQRIVFIDILRAFAVLSMLQGHTIDAFLADSYRNYDNIYFLFWTYVRGFTAPVFLFTSGMIFTLLFFKAGGYVKENPRVKKTYLKIAGLFVLGYLLRARVDMILFLYTYPLEEIKRLLQVDILQLFSISMLMLMGIFYSLRKKQNLTAVVLIAAGTFFFLMEYAVKEIIIDNRYLLPFTAYLNRQTGSNFPPFPWTGFYFFGSAAGYLLFRCGDNIQARIKLYKSFSYAGFIVLVIVSIIDYFGVPLFENYSFWDNPVLAFFRIGLIFIIAGILAGITEGKGGINQWLLYLSKNSLWVYAVHITIVYGSAYTLGFIYLFNRNLSLLQSILSVFWVLGATILVLKMKDRAIEYYRSRTSLAAE